MSENSTQFYYSLSTSKGVLMALMLMALPFGIAQIAMHNHRGIRFFHIITLPPADATLFFWGLAIACGIAAVMGLISFYNQLKSPKTIELNADHALLPKASIFGGQLNIPYKSIQNISRRKVTASIEMTVIKSTVGEARVLSENFRGLLKYEDFLLTLGERLKN